MPPNPTQAVGLDWLIVGGGLHGVHLAVKLLAEGGVSASRLRIVDPAERLLARWRACTAMTGMSHLRSPSVHHLDLDPWSLQRFAGKRKSRARRVFAPPYDRPALELFDAHCDDLIERYGLAELHIRDRAIASSIDCDAVDVRLAGGETLRCQHLVLAIGASEQPAWPRWATDVGSSGRDPRVQHVFAHDFDGWPQQTEAVAVVGGGISAGQIALRLLNEGHRVHLVSRHGLRQHQFDSDPGWLGPRFMADFWRERDLDRRRALITEARHKGSVSPDVGRALRRAINRERLAWHESDVERLDARADGLILGLHDGSAIAVDRVLLATGFTADRPGGALVDALIESAALPCARCGYPVVDAALRWHPRIHVSGPLAELELGPSSRNIAGARRAAERLLAGLQQGDGVAERRAMS